MGRLSIASFYTWKKLRLKIIQLVNTRERTRTEASNDAEWWQGVGLWCKLWGLEFVHRHMHVFSHTHIHKMGIWVDACFFFHVSIPSPLFSSGNHLFFSWSCWSPNSRLAQDPRSLDIVIGPEVVMWPNQSQTEFFFGRWLLIHCVWTWAYLQL